MNRRKLLNRLAEGNLANVRFSDLVNLMEGFGFEFARVHGSHHIFKNPAIPEMLNVQDVAGKAKPYQIRQLLRLIERHNLQLEEDV